jgi:hypothetical protein
VPCGVAAGFCSPAGALLEAGNFSGAALTEVIKISSNPTTRSIQFFDFISFFLHLF